MKTVILTIAALALTAGAGFGQNKTFNGEIMDSACAKMGSHAMMEKEHKMAHDAKACTMGCVKAGAKYVLYDAATKKVYALDDQTRPEAFAGQKVKVNGTLDSSTDTIHVAGITGA